MTVLLVRCCFIVDAVGSISQKLNGKTGVSTISRNSPLQMPIMTTWKFQFFFISMDSFVCVGCFVVSTTWPQHTMVLLD